MNKTQIPFITVLGIAQDGGVPHCGCQRSCCRAAWQDLSKHFHATSIAIIDPVAKQRWLIEATPDLKFQLARLDEVSTTNKHQNPVDGIFITHGHIGHYTGLLFLEKSVLNTKDCVVYVMPKMREFLQNNRPWKDLVEMHHIRLISLIERGKVLLNERISLIPFLIPHRADREYSETVGFQIKGPNKSILFLPDVDTWATLFPSIEELISTADIAFIDGTFFDASELVYRNIKEVPHPFVRDSIKGFNRLSKRERGKINFIHMNHTNPLLAQTIQRQRVLAKGFCVAKEKSNFLI